MTGGSMILAVVVLVGCGAVPDQRPPSTSEKAADSPAGTTQSQAATKAGATTGAAGSADASAQPADAGQAADNAKAGGDEVGVAAANAPLEVMLINVTSNTTGEVGTARKISNILSLAATKDPWKDNLPDRTQHVLENWSYTRDPERTLVMKMTLSSYTRKYTDTQRDKWWAVIGKPKVTSFTGQWAVGDEFAKHAKDGYGVQWSFNYRVTKVAP